MGRAAGERLKLLHTIEPFEIELRTIEPLEIEPCTIEPRVIITSAERERSMRTIHIDRS